MKAVSIKVPSDKSISHRAVMLASVSKGTTHIKNLLIAEDIKRTIEAFRAMGVEIRGNGVNIAVRGVGMTGLKKPSGPLYLGNSGTTMRVLPGILAGQDFEVILTGDKSLSGRPMKRIVEPLVKMGAEIASGALRPRNDKKEVIASEAKQSHENYPPLRIRGGTLKAIKYKSKIASAQVKSCILLAGLYADGVTISPKEVILAIDEIPVIMVAACFAKGKTVIKGIKELRVKETDRVYSIIAVQIGRYSVIPEIFNRESTTTK